VRLAVLGDPVEHSLSPLLHTTALRHCGLAGTFEAIQVDRSGMEQAIAEIGRGELDGANVTMPHKRMAYELCAHLTSDADRTGAVNTLVRVAGEVVGHNTDIQGVRNAWVWAGLPDHTPVVVYGAGGAAAAALVALDGRRVTVRARSDARAEALTSQIGVGSVGPWGPPEPGSVLLNATPIGMQGESFPAGWLDDVAGVFDMAYAAEQTPTARQAVVAGVPVVSGPDMLLGQAIVSFWLWTGRKAPIDAMRRVLAAVRQSPIT